MLEKINSRKVLLVEPEFQKPFILFTIVGALSVALIYFVSLEIFYWHFQSSGVAMGLSPDHIFFLFLSEQRFFLNTIFLVTAVVASSVLLLMGLYYSNRIAGPLFHVKTYLRAYREGQQMGPLKFRENDYFSSVADEINQTLAVTQK